MFNPRFNNNIYSAINNFKNNFNNINFRQVEYKPKDKRLSPKRSVSRSRSKS